MENTEYMIKDSLDSLRGIYKFEFCFVNMIDVERRLETKDFSLLSVLSEKETEHLETLINKKNKLQWVAGRYAVKSALFKYKLSDPSCVDVLKGADSAPYIEQYPELNVSITHSFPYCIGIVAENKIGVDLEMIRETKESLIKRFYSSRERDELIRFKGTEEYSRKAVMYWTRKEAASKAVKMGMNLDFKGLDTSYDRIRVNSLGIYLKSIICNGFYLSVAFEEQEVGLP
jgi:4'-phosphopantetheinyl transferase